jgi:hypothetical protein
MHLHQRRTGSPAWWAAAVAVVLFALPAGCGGSDDADDAGGEPPESTAPASTDDTEPPDATAAAEGPREWVEVARDLYERDFALRSDPEPSRVADLYSETCSCWEDQSGTIEFLAENNERIEGSAATVLFVRHELTDPETGLVNLTVKGQTNSLRRVSSDGELVQEIPADEPSCIAYALLADGPGGIYRIYSMTSLPECPEGA